MKYTRSALAGHLRDLGVEPNDLLMIHGSMRAVGPVIGGVHTVIQALLDAVGPGGTLTAYVDFEPYFDDDDPEEHIPVFDKRIAIAAKDHGILHEALRTWPCTSRSDHPDAGVCALGPLAYDITRTHPLQYGYGPGTPFERILNHGARVLMLGAPLDTITILHYAEAIARIPGKKLVRYRRNMPGLGWVDIEEFDTSEPVHELFDEGHFEQIARDFLRSGYGVQARVGNAVSYLFDAPELVRFGVEWMERRVNLA